jgi:hypothetical protein
MSDYRRLHQLAEDTSMKARSTVNALLAVTASLLEAKKAARARRAAAALTSGVKVARRVTAARPLLGRLTTEPAA